MENFDIGLTLTKIRGAQLITGKTGKRAVLLPIDECPDVKEKDGAAYLDLSAVVTKNQQYSTHCIMGGWKDADGSRGEIVGHMKPWNMRRGGPDPFIAGAAQLTAKKEMWEAGTVQQAPPAQTPPAAPAYSLEDESDDDLPF